MATPITIVPAGGMVLREGADRLDQPLGSFQTLVNLRLQGSSLQQTPPFYTYGQHSPGNYYDGGTQTEPATSVASLLLYLATEFWASQYCAFSGGTQVQVIRQTSVPATTTEFTSCCAVINDYAALNLTLGSTLDVEMTGAAAFRWRKNGGGWTAGVPSLTGTSIDSGSVTLYFLASTGFAGTETWAWTRTDALYETGGIAQTYDWSYVVYLTQVYFVDYAGRVLVFENGGIRSVGFRPVYGTHVALFENHLFVANYSATVFTAGAASCVNANSDLNVFDNFYPTDVNEADTYLIPNNVLESDSRAARRIRGYFLKNQVLYVFTSTGIWAVQYYGLPLVFKHTFIQSFATTSNFAQPVVSGGKCYLVSSFGLYVFDGNNLQRIGQEIVGGHVGDASSAYFLLTSFRWGGTNPQQQEIWFYNEGSSTLAGGYVTPTQGAGFYVYQEATNTWYFRAANFTTYRPRTMAVIVSGNTVALSYSFGVALSDDTFSNATSSTILADSPASLVQPPYLITQDLTFNEVQVVHEVNELYMDAYYGDDPTTGYGTSGIKVEVAKREYAQGTVTFVNAALSNYVKTDTAGAISHRTSGRILRYRISGVASATTKAVCNMVFNRLVLSVLNLRKDAIRS